MTRIAKPIALVLIICALWPLMHHYQGISRDAGLYAFQALARIQLPLSKDIYLNNVSQDRFTIFSPIYAVLVAGVGLRHAALALFIASTTWFLIATWKLTDVLFDGRVAPLAVCMIVITAGSYGAFDVFHYAEDFLTARNLAEALVVSAIALELRSLRRWAVLAIGTALVVHPLMAFPGLMLLVFWSLSLRRALLTAGAGMLLTVLAAFEIVHLADPASGAVVDANWLNMLQERSKFLFLQFWSVGDWLTHARAFLSLALSMTVISRVDIRKFCASSALVGACGLGVAGVASLVAPVALLIQGQAWRWFWITEFTAILLVVPTVFHLWRDPRCGPICAMLLVSSWTFPEANGVMCIGAAVLMYAVRGRISVRGSRYLNIGGIALASIAIAWVAANLWNYSRPTFDFLNEPLIIQRLQNVFALQLPAILCCWLIWYLVTLDRTRLNAALCMALLPCSAVFLYYSIAPSRSAGSSAEVDEFSDWRALIPENSSVYTVDGRDSPLFAWFTLGRTSYLSIDQSAGIVFSRKTALEIKRRAEVLQPLMEPDWRLQTRSDSSRNRESDPIRNPLLLGAAALIRICEDPELGFVVSKQRIGSGFATHLHAGSWRGWNLYDCSNFRLQEFSG